MQLIGYLNCTGKLFFLEFWAVWIYLSHLRKKSSQVFINVRGKDKMICWEKWLKDWDTLASFCACSQEWSQKFQQNSSQNVGRIIDHMRIMLQDTKLCPIHAFSQKLPRKWKCFFIVGHPQFDPYSYNVFVKCTHVQKNLWSMKSVKKFFT